MLDKIQACGGGSGPPLTVTGSCLKSLSEVLSYLLLMNLGAEVHFEIQEQFSSV